MVGSSVCTKRDKMAKTVHSSELVMNLSIRELEQIESHQMHQM